MLIYTADEAWEHITHKPKEDAGLPSVHLALLPEPSGSEPTDDQREEWRLLMDLRDPGPRPARQAHPLRSASTKLWMRR